MNRQGLLKVSVAKRIVNPTKPAVPVGHGCTTFYSEGHSDICVHALVLEDQVKQRIVWITCDFAQVADEVTDQIKRLVRERYGIEPTAVCVHATHNHAAPPIVRKEAPEEFDSEYADYFIKQVVGVVGDALPKLAPARLRYCEDVCTSVAINRRGKRDGKFGIIPNNKGIVDFKVRVITAESVADGEPIVVAVEYAAHPVVIEASGLGGEYPSFMREFIEKKYPNVTAMFFQGCAGNIRIQILNEERTGWIKGTPEMSKQFGHDLADAAERALTKEGEPVVGPIETEYKEIQVPIKSETEPKTLPLRIQAFRFGAKSKKPFTLVALGAEPFIEYGLELEKRLQPANTVVIGYANACAAYLPTAQACKEGGYEPNAWKERIYSLCGPYAPEVESVVLEAVTELARPKH